MHDVGVSLPPDILDLLRRFEDEYERRNHTRPTIMRASLSMATMLRDAGVDLTPTNDPGVYRYALLGGQPC